MFPDVESMLDLSHPDAVGRDLIVHAVEESDGLGAFVVHHFLGKAIK